MTETTEQTRKCFNCMWWETPDREANNLGVCKGSPPSLLGDGTVGWPITFRQQWCGSFRMKEPGQ